MTAHDKRLGERIRELRIRLGITQRELAGDRITRNMLSLIESGNASPSVSTLLYIAERLGTSVGYFFTSSEADEGRYFKLSIIDELKERFREGNYRECERICESVPQSARDDELSYLAAISYLHTALAAAETLDLVQAMKDINTARSYADRSIYADSSFDNALRFYGELFRTVCSDTVPELLCDYGVCGAYVPVPLVRYFSALTDNRTGYPGSSLYLSAGPESEYYVRHIRAVSLLTDGRTSDAMKLFRELSADHALPYYMKYRVLCGLEQSADAAGDFRLAYNASRRKLEMIEKCRILF
ncbi:MAG: helix-turn-helix transcriptional regulator [Ruminococcaceae bacterium]|nr:helix-turn-helix transcriptional regulator [Oscillospiraceae bacterium]